MGYRRLLILILLLFASNFPLNTHATAPQQIKPNQNPTVVMEPTFFALIANGNGNEETDNLITFEKTSSQAIVLQLDGDFAVDTPSLKDKVYFTLFGPDGSNISYYERNEDHIIMTFNILADWNNGVYQILIDLGTPPSEPLNCCAGYNYKVAYSGLSQPPQIEGLGTSFGFSPGYGYIPIRNFGLNENFTFFGYPGSFVFYHQAWGDNNVLLNVTLVDANDNTQQLQGDPTNSGKVLFNFDIISAGYYKLMIYTSFDQKVLGRITGYKLTENNSPSENAQKIINLFIGAYGALDSDFDLIKDLDEVSIGTNLHLADSDGDHVYDGLEVQFGTNPLDTNSKPVDISSVVHSNSQTHQFDIGIKIMGSTQPFTKITYEIILNSKFTADSPENLTGTFDSLDKEEFKILINTKNEVQPELSFPFEIHLAFYKVNSSESVVYAYSLSHIKPQFTTDDVIGYTSPPSLPIPFLSFSSILTTIFVLLPIIRKYDHRN